MVLEIGRRILNSNPSTFILSFGIWALICGGGLLMPGNIFDFNPAWSSLQAIHADDTSWGLAMAFNGTMLIASLRMNKVPQRASIAASSAIMWLLLGLSMVLSAYKLGHVSIIGAYSIYGALGCLLAVEQWVHHTDGDRASGVR